MMELRVCERLEEDVGDDAVDGKAGDDCYRDTEANVDSGFSDVVQFVDQVDDGVHFSFSRLGFKWRRSSITMESIVPRVFDFVC